MSSEQSQVAKPLAQGRSRAKQTRLLDVGLLRIEQHPFDSLNVSDIALEAGCSVGAFYRSFDNKRGFLLALQEIATAQFLDRAREEFAPARWESAKPLDIVKRMVRFLIAERARVRGLAETSLKLSGEDPQVWTRFYQAGREFNELIETLLLEHINASAHPSRRLAIAFATQTVYAVLNQVTLLHVGALQLDDQRLEEQLWLMTSRYLGFE